MERCHEDVKDLLMKEIGDVVKKGSLSTQDIEFLYSAYDIIKDIYEVKEKEEESFEKGYSGRWNGMPYDDRYYNIHAYRGGNGYSMNGYPMNNGYSQMNRDNGYSRNDEKDYMINSMYSMMENASEKERTAIQDCINKLKGMN